MIAVLTPKRISPDYPFHSNQRLTKISILTPHLRGMMHTAELYLVTHLTVNNACNVSHVMQTPNKFLTSLV